MRRRGSLVKSTKANRLNNTSVPGQTRTRRVVLIAGQGTEILDLVGPLQVFTRAADMFSRQNPGASPIYAVEVVATTSRTAIMTNCELRITAHKTFREIRGEIDTLLVAGGAAIEKDEIPIEVVRWLRKIAGHIRRIGSVCTGALLLGRAGILDGRRATTHWNWCALLARKYPRAEVDPDPIFVRDDMVYTSAGVTAGMGLALALVEEEHGSRPALQVARNLVPYLRRPGGPPQISASPFMQLTYPKPLRELDAWGFDNPNNTLNVAVLG